MKLIPGHTFTVGRQESRGGSLLEKKQRNQLKRNDSMFVYGHTYKIWFIHVDQEAETYTYKFKDLTTNEFFETKFKSIKEAESRILRLCT